MQDNSEEKLIIKVNNDRKAKRFGKAKYNQTLFTKEFYDKFRTKFDLVKDDKQLMQIGN